jgi:valyl-tRNA synthetase
MSKSIGNVVDPLVIIKERGADVLRLTLASLVTSGGQDIRLVDDKLVASRNFVNKLWNVSRYILMQEPVPAGDLGANPVDLWILAELDITLQKVRAYFESYDFNFAIEALYEFTWGTFCDWYIEMTKLHKETSQATLIYVLNALLKMWHPVIPFVTEELWQKLKDHPLFPKEEKALPTIMRASWPKPLSLGSHPVISIMPVFQEIVRTVRNLKAEINAPLNKKGDLYLSPSAKGLADLVPYGLLLARLDSIHLDEDCPTTKALLGLVEHHQLALPLEGLVDTQKERERLQKEADKLSADIDRISAKLSHPGFTSKAPPAVIEQEKKNLAERREQLKVLSGKLAEL